MSSIDILSEDRIRQALTGHAAKLEIECRGQVTSTNSILKERAFGNECALIAHSQTCGRGRLGRSFFSPEDTGLYLSLLIKPSLPAEKLILLTPAAAVAACSALEALGSERIQIKWVNDLILGSRKICGILTELTQSPDGGASVIVGVGMNVYPPKNGFPDEISSIAGYIFPERQADLRNRLAAEFINRFIHIYQNIDTVDFVHEYRTRSCVVGRRVNVIRGDSVRTALALDIDSQCRLLVRYDDGDTEALSSGEITIRAI